MTQILELREIGGDLWARLPKLEGESGCFYIVTHEEKKEEARRILKDFCLSLASRYITDNCLYEGGP